MDRRPEGMGRREVDTLREAHHMDLGEGTEVAHRPLVGVDEVGAGMALLHRGCEDHDLHHRRDIRTAVLPTTTLRTRREHAQGLRLQWSSHRRIRTSLVR